MERLARGSFVGIITHCCVILQIIPYAVHLCLILLLRFEERSLFVVKINSAVRNDNIYRRKVGVVILQESLLYHFRN